MLAKRGVIRNSPNDDDDGAGDMDELTDTDNGEIWWSHTGWENSLGLSDGCVFTKMNRLFFFSPDLSHRSS